MLYSKNGYPEEGEFVLCTITKIQYHSVFCNLDIYDRSGMIHISEIAPGRIRNVRNYVQEGKKVICKVLGIDEEKGHIDLSLRRVTESQKKAKMEVVQKEQKAERIIENAADDLDMDTERLYDKVTTTLFADYEMLFLAFEDVVEEELDLQDYFDDDIADALTEHITERISPKRVEITGTLSMHTYASDGLDIVKEALEEATVDGAEYQYEGSGEYRVSVTAPDYDEAEDILEQSVENARNVMEDSGGEVAFAR